jgi:SAM-dependent methyltransferase
MSSLTSLDREKLEKYYLESINEYGKYDPQALHWISKQSQQLRFEALYRNFDLEKKSLLDVGCGYGDLFEFLSREKTLNLEYQGIDFMQEFVEAAKQKFPQNYFFQGDFLELSVTRKFDFVVGVGITSIRYANSEEYYYSLVKKMYECSNNSAIVTFLRKGEHPENETYITFRPSEILQKYMEITPNLRIISDYLRCEFMLVLTKDKFGSNLT